MERIIILFTFVLLLGFCPAIGADNIAYRDNNVRFTIISDGVVRIEYAPDGHFFDGRSFIAVEREYPQVDYRIRETKNRVVITTSRMILTYQKGAAPFSAENLKICSHPKASIPFEWHPGKTNHGNLLGTYRTLDGYNGNMRGNNPMPIEDGLLSTEGWTLIDDSEGYAFDNSDWPWVTSSGRAEGAVDWYFMAYGHDYKQALGDFTRFSGKVPLPPRYAFGYWWSRYWHYSDNDYRDLVRHFEEYRIPVDVMVIDMDWHYISDGLGDWTGYTWNRRLFPKPERLLSMLKKQGMKVTLNLHPANGVRPFEEHYGEMARRMGIDAEKNETIGWEVSSKRFMSAWFDTQLKPLEKQGVDFWWLDWQQWGNDRDFPNLSNIWWINYAAFTNMANTRSERPMIYHRWGGLGNHRYQIGFSGDSYISWASLDFQPYFNATASNVLYGYWSHDIGGHFRAPSIDPELYIRWMQFGLFSPILRTHSSKSEVLNKEPWMFAEEHASILRSIIRERYAFAPYIYTMARNTYDTGVALCRPMYYDYPEAREAYEHKNEYMFGDNLLIDPITEPMTDSIAYKEVWLPEGNDWWELHTGTLLTGGQHVTRKFLIDEYPVYVKAGTLLPQYEQVSNLKTNDAAITIIAIPGGGDSAFTLYEDNGDDQHYATEYATTLLTADRGAHSVKVTIHPREGHYQDMPAKRDFKVKFPGSAMPSSVRVNGQEADYEYIGNELTVAVTLPARDCNATDVVEVWYPEDAPVVTDGLAGVFRRLHQAVFRAKQRDAKLVISEELGVLESSGLALEYYPEEFADRLARFRELYSRLPEILAAQERFPAERIDHFVRTVKE